MTKLIQLAQSKGWDETTELIKFAIPKEHPLIVNGDGEMVANSNLEERKEVGYYVMRQIERWLMIKHNIYIAFQALKCIYGHRFCYFIFFEDRKPIHTHPDDAAPETIDEALFEALTVILKLIPDA